MEYRVLRRIFTESRRVLPELHAGPNFQTRPDPTRPVNLCGFWDPTRPDPTRGPIHNGKSCKTNNELNVYLLLF